MRLGYKQTEVGAIPEDWEVRTVGGISEVKTGPFGSALHKKDYVDEGTPIITVEHLGERGVLHTGVPQVSDADAARLGAYGLRQGDIVFSRVGSVDRNALIRSDEDGWLFSGRLLRVRPKRREVHSPYLSHYFHSEAFKQRVRDVAVGQTMASINTQILMGVWTAIPPTKAEQQAIADALSDADALIEFLEQLLVKKRLLKRGAMQQLLTGTRRLPGFVGEWEVKRLGELGSTFGGLSGKSKNDFGRGAARYITFMNIMTNVVIDCDTFERVDVDPTESQNRVVMGDLFFNGSSEIPEEVGMCAVLTRDVHDVFLNSFCFGFRLRDDAPADGLYLAYFFRSRAGRELLKSLAQGAIRYNLSKTALLKVVFPLPRLLEQTAIASILSDMDAEIAALEARIAKARQLKQGMMQELLTGRLRLV